ncbi:MAG: tripartite tricarboxylate transporter TctB family protein [Trueperaceae bacterium]
MHRADLIIGIVLTLFGAVVVRESLVMPRFASIGADPVTAPGLVPGLLGGIIGLLGLLMAVRATLGLRAAASAAPTEASAPEDADDGTEPRYVVESPHAGRNRLATMLVAGLIFAGLAVGRLPFWLATFLFVFVTVALLEFQRYGRGRAVWQRLAVALVIAGGTAWAVMYVFESIFLVRLP